METEDCWLPAKWYAHFIDTRDYAALPELFTPDARLVVGANTQGVPPVFDFQGTDAIVGAMSALNMYDSTFHQLGQQQILERATNTLHTESYCTASHFYTQADQNCCYTLFIRYLDTLINERGRWRFQERLLYLQGQQGIPAEPA